MHYTKKNTVEEILPGHNLQSSWRARKFMQNFLANSTEVGEWSGKKLKKQKY